MNTYWISLPCDLLSSLASFQCSLLHHLHLSSDLGLSKYVNQHSHLNLSRNVRLSVLYDLDFNIFCPSHGNRCNQTSLPTIPRLLCFSPQWHHTLSSQRHDPQTPQRLLLSQRCRCPQLPRGPSLPWQQVRARHSQWRGPQLSRHNENGPFLCS